MKRSRSTFYASQKRSVKLLNKDTLELHQKTCSLFSESREGLGYCMLGAQLRQESYTISDYRVRNLMKLLGLAVKQKKYSGTSKGKATATGDNLLNQNLVMNSIW